MSMFIAAPFTIPKKQKQKQPSIYSSTDEQAMNIVHLQNGTYLFIYLFIYENFRKMGRTE